MIKPAAGMVDEPPGIQDSYEISGLKGIKLSPALVKGHPADNGGMVIKRFYRIPGFAVKKLLPFFFSSGKKGAALFPVIHGPVKGIEKSSHISDEPVAVRGASAYHVLPYEHAQPVAVVIPALRLYFYMLSYHVEAQLLHGTDIEEKGLVAGSGIKPVGPVALIQHACLHIGGIV